jgi:hypothetical protein
MRLFWTVLLSGVLLGIFLTIMVAAWWLNRRLLSLTRPRARAGHPPR